MCVRLGQDPDRFRNMVELRLLGFVSGKEAEGEGLRSALYAASRVGKGGPCCVRAWGTAPEYAKRNERKGEHVSKDLLQGVLNGLRNSMGGRQTRGPWEDEGRALKSKVMGAEPDLSARMTVAGGGGGMGTMPFCKDVAPSATNRLRNLGSRRFSVERGRKATQTGKT